MMSFSHFFVIVWFCMSHLSNDATAFQQLTISNNNYRIQQQQQHHRQYQQTLWVRSVSTIRPTTQLHVIKADDNDFVFDEGAGGVRLATESVVKIMGNVKHSPGKVEPGIKDLVRYTKLHKVSDNTIVEKNLNSVGGIILCTGSGKELYKDPGTTTDAVIILASNDAVKNALNNAKSAMASTSLVINFAGSTDSQVLEVLESIRKLILSLDIPTKTKITFNSIGSSDILPLTSSVTVVSFDEKSTTTNTDNEVIRTSVEKAIVSGEIYNIQGSYYILLEDDINTAEA
jgi:hypothetical protein